MPYNGHDAKQIYYQEAAVIDYKSITVASSTEETQADQFGSLMSGRARQYSSPTN